MQKMLPTRRSLQTGRGQPTASGLQKWRRPKTADKGFQQQDWGCCHLRKSSPRGSPCCHFGKIKFIEYIAMLFLTFGVDLFLPLGWGYSIYDTNIMYHCGIYSPFTRNCQQATTKGQLEQNEEVSICIAYHSFKYKEHGY